ncbi:MAG TPA: hypothetical protein VFG50_10175 [Rhodothermales bacterium]|nr:hypothetical protein [Rhodothermales bacterium]
MKNMLFRSVAVAALISTPLVFAACDATGSEGEVTIHGRVTDNATYGQSGSDVQDASVQARQVDDDGETHEADGSAQTDQSGRYTLNVSNATDVMLVTATDSSGFNSSTLVYTDGKSSVNAAPVTAESDAEAQVYLEARQEDEGSDVTLGDVAAYVTSEVAAQIKAGEATAAQVAAVLRAEARARAETLRQQASEEKARAVHDEELNAYLTLQSDLSAATSVQAAEEATASFENAFVDAYDQADVDARVMAQAELAARAALDKFDTGVGSSQARSALHQRAQVLAALATSQATTETFRARDAASARVDAVEQAGATLVGKVRAAASTDAITQAYADYQATVKQQLADELGVALAAVNAALDATATATTALQVGVAAAGSASQIADLYATFFTASEAAISQSLAGNAKAELGASVLAILAVQ